MNYEEALQYIHGARKFASKLGLANITELLRRLGNPHRDYKIVHIAGTNGKGSVTAMTSRIVYQAGYKVGMFISPYLERFTERIQINFQEIAEEELAYLTSIVKVNVTGMVNDGFNYPTEFEIVTALGFLYFSRQRVDIAVVEVGLGGRFDSTNVVNPLISVITSISYDHEKILGDTLEKIAYEKGGIIKETVPVVSYPQKAEASKALRHIAQCRNSLYVEVAKDSIVLKVNTLEIQKFDYISKGIVFEDIKIHLPGVHQLYNASCVLETVMLLRKYGLHISNSAIYEGFDKTRWPGRIEKVLDNPLTIIDGAHNPSGAKALADAIQVYFPDKRVHLILGILKDKNVDDIAKTLCNIADKVTVTTVSNNPRALSAKELSHIVKREISNVDIKANINDAIKSAFKEASESDVIVISGSLYLVGEARTILCSH